MIIWPFHVAIVKNKHYRMKRINILTGWWGLVLLAALSACEHTVSTETTVHPDGSLDKVISCIQKDTTRNLWGLDAGQGWRKYIEAAKDSAGNPRKDTWVVRCERSFASADEANAALATDNDTLLRVTSHFERNFRWFYTYLRYSETIHALNNLTLPPTDYLTPEDYAFIDRLPAEGQPISKADQFFLDRLQSRIYDDYGMRAYFEEYYGLLSGLLSSHGIEQRWLDTLARHKEHLFQLAQRKDADDDFAFMFDALDSLGLPINREIIWPQYQQAMKQFESKVNFISTASDGTYHHRIRLPWSLVETNADSVAGQDLFWSPPAIKFLLRDYTMYGESRKLNGWAVVLSIGLVGVTVYAFVRKKRG
jgi:hypothetical protein